MKIALVEVYNAHAECLYTQLKILNSKFNDVTLICPTGLQQQVVHFGHKNTIFKDCDFSKKAVKEYRQFLNDGNYDVIIFNTTQGKLKKLFYSFKKLKCKNIYGTLHNVKKLKGSLGQAIIDRNIKGYFVLSDYIAKNAKALAPKKKFQTFYPLLFPSFNTINLPKSEDEIWLTIPGSLEFFRRDFEGFFKLLQQTKLNKNIKIILLGRSKHEGGNYNETIDAITSAGVREQFVIFEQFVDNETFHSYMQQSDYILPLLHPNHSSLQKYQYKISGSFNQAYAYNLPLVLHEHFAQYNEFKEHPTIFYKVEGLINTLNNLQQPLKQASLLKQRVLKEQRDNYLEFIIE